MLPLLLCVFDVVLFGDGFVHVAVGVYVAFVDTVVCVDAPINSGDVDIVVVDDVGALAVDVAHVGCCC